MRASRAIGLGLLVLLGCREDVAEPDLRRPLESVPAGACVLLLSSDLAGVWDRAEAHDATAILHRLLPAQAFQIPGLQEMQSRIRGFDARTGRSLRQDLLLNLVGQRLAVAGYPATDADGLDILLVAELDDADRFRSVIETLRHDSLGASFQVEETALDGRPGLRLHQGNFSALLVQDDRFVVLATADTLARGALAIHAGRSQASALRDPACVQALDAVGRHNLTIVGWSGSGASDWWARGITWDHEGVRFKWVTPATAAQPAHETRPGAAPERRTEILRSVPAGMTLAYYARSFDFGLLRGLFRDPGQCMDLRRSEAPGTGFEARPAAGPSGTQVVPAAPPLGFEQLPFSLDEEMAPWVGDEMAVVLAELVPTALAPIPSAGLIVEVADPQSAAQLLRRFESSLSGLPVGIRAEDFVDVEYGGKTFRSFSQPILEAVSPSYLLDGDVAILTTTRQLMQQIIDTRRVGKRSLLHDATFRPFDSFVPHDASAVVYADQKQLHRVLMQVAQLPRLWGDNVARVVEVVEGMSVLFEHFPAGAVYLERTPDGLSLNGWMREGS